MATITNKTRRPLAVVLPEGKKLRLGPLASAEISAKACKTAAVAKLVEAGTVAIGEGPTKGGRGGQVAGGPPGAARGQGMSGGIRKTGDR
ncbi:MAG: hypothetical protein ACJAYU_001439 [Bradymonadia bacterium]|jgi:hypothetical protein